MDWSKTRRLLEDRLAAPAQGRVRIHVTRYHRAHDQEGELWVTIDGSKVYGTSYYQFIKRRSELAPPSPDWRPTAEHFDVETQLASEGVSNHTRLISAAIDSLSHSVEEMLRSPHPLIRALAILIAGWDDDGWIRSFSPTSTSWSDWRAHCAPSRKEQWIQTDDRSA